MRQKLKQNLKQKLRKKFALLAGLSLVFVATAVTISPVLAAVLVTNSAPEPQGAGNAGNENKITDPEIAREIEIGRKAVKMIEEQWPLSSDPGVLAKLNMILRRLEPHMKRKLPYELRLVTTEVQNAFCLPGGFIFFTTGIVDLLQTDSELAAVMAHEMIHADQKHSLRMAAESQKISLAALAVMLLSGGSMAPIVLAQVAQVAITNAYTIELEAEADRMGLDVLIASGYSPTGMVTLLEKFMDEDLKQPIREYGIYMDHPKSTKRLSTTLATLRERGIPVTRKIPLGLLRTDIQNSRGKVTLRVDGEPVWSGKSTPMTLQAVEKVRAILDSDLQLELAPYDIHIIGDALYIRNTLVTGPVPDMGNPDDLREKLLRVLNRARRRHPTAKYFQ